MNLPISGRMAWSEETLQAAGASEKVTATSYDEVPYASYPFPQTHPSHLAVIATLFGLQPPPVQHCRVLELGCAAGGNLLPMAEALPQSSFVGVDLSARQIADGQRILQALGLANVRLVHASILDVDRSWGQFDYIICHGVYSWVPDRVREKILAICAEQLSPQGVAYISYNTYPGWHMRGMIRDMMRYHALRFTTPGEQIRQARALLDFLAQATRIDGGPYATLLRMELEHLRQQADHYLYHEHLEEVNEPVYFHEFIAAAQRHGLNYLGDAQITTMLSSNFPYEVQQALQIIAPDQIQSEQYLDFVRNRMFRETLLVRGEVQPDWTVQPERIDNLHVCTHRRVVDESGDVRSTTTVQYRSKSGMVVATSQPTLKAAFRILGEEWPGTLPFADLVARVTERLGQPPEQVRTPLAVQILHVYLSSDLMELHALPIPRVPVTERPQALRSLRVRLELGENGGANRRHEVFRPNPFDSVLIPLLDGTRTKPELLEELTRRAARGLLLLPRETSPSSDLEGIRTRLAPLLEEALQRLADASVLVA
ncbi:MAG: class I SAM-dependent methyltransferase [Thermogemmata sp.]